MPTRADLNSRREEAHWGRGNAPTARYIDGRKVQAAGHIDEYGMYYPIPPSRWRGLMSFLTWTFAIVALIALIGAIVFGSGPLAQPRTTIAPLPTATDRRPADSPPARPQITIDTRGGTEPGFDPLPTIAPPPPPDQAGVDGNAIDAAPAVEPTPLPEPGADGFQESFKPAGCPMGVTILDHNDPCYTVPPGAKLPEPGEDGFVESFK